MEGTRGFLIILIFHHWLDSKNNGQTVYACFKRLVIGEEEVLAILTVLLAKFDCFPSCFLLELFLPHALYNVVKLLIVVVNKLIA